MDVVTLTERAPYLDRVVVVLSSGDLTNQNWVCFFVPAFHGFKSLHCFIASSIALRIIGHSSGLMLILP
jgi:hypothetical protein